jgi:hypothetical protein
VVTKFSIDVTDDDKLSRREHDILSRGSRQLETAGLNGPVNSPLKALLISTPFFLPGVGPSARGIFSSTPQHAEAQYRLGAFAGSEGLI